MKYLFSLLLIFTSLGSFAQDDFKDTLYYKSGWERPVTILSIKKGKLYFLCDGKKGVRETSISLSSIKGYKSDNPEFSSNEMSQYDENESTGSIDDTLEYTVRPGLFSISPIDLALLGIGLDFSYRFNHGGSALHIPFRATTLAAQTGYISVGLGYSYFVKTSSNSDFLITAAPTLFAAGGNTWGAIIVGLGGVRYFNSKLGLNGFFGLGPGFGANAPSVWFDFHVGIAFRFGESKTSEFVKQ